jgi:hypothetical protein
MVKMHREIHRTIRNYAPSSLVQVRDSSNFLWLAEEILSASIASKTADFGGCQFNVPAANQKHNGVGLAIVSSQSAPRALLKPELIDAVAVVAPSTGVISRIQLAETSCPSALLSRALC